MRVKVNDVHLFVDCIGSALRPAQTSMQKKPSILLLHGGPGMDHSVFRPALDHLADVAQLVCFDHRGCGRSDQSDPSSWHLKQWTADAAALIDILSLEQPIVLGTSFGGFVAQQLAAQHPEKIGGLVLMSSAARPDIARSISAITAKAGIHAGKAAQEFLGGDISAEVQEKYFSECLPLYSARGLDAEAISRVIMRDEVMLHFFQRDGEMHTVDLREQLQQISAPTLILHGQEDPVFPIQLAEEMFSLLKTENKSLKAIPNCSHLIEQDAPDVIINAITDFFHL
jgi:proline iminopeptidase